MLKVGEWPNMLLIPFNTECTNGFISYESNGYAASSSTRTGMSWICFRDAPGNVQSTALNFLIECRICEDMSIMYFSGHPTIDVNKPIYMIHHSSLDDGGIEPFLVELVSIELLWCYYWNVSSINCTSDCFSPLNKIALCIFVSLFRCVVLASSLHPDIQTIFCCLLKQSFAVGIPSSPS